MKKIIVLILFTISFGFIQREAFGQNLSFTSIREIPSVLKRGKTYEINWTGGVPDEPVAIQLIDKNGATSELNTIANTGQHSIHIPNRTKPGTYSLKLFSIKSGEISLSKEISIKRRVPLIVQLSPLIVIPAIILIATRPHDDNDIKQPALPDNVN